MKKSIKTLTLALMLAITALCMCVFAAACDNDKKNGTDYAVIVVYPDGKAVDGTKDGTGGTDDKSVTVQFCEVDANHKELQCLPVVKLGADGKAIKSKSDLPEIAEGHSWHIKLNGLPAGYTFDDNNYMSEPDTITITLKTV